VALELEMTKLMVAVKSCQADKARGCHEAIRRTWGGELKRLGVETRFFVGADNDNYVKYESDEVSLRCEDTYDELPFKVREICKWGYGKTASHIFFTDVDVCVFAKNLLSSDFEDADYVGRFHEQKPNLVTRREILGRDRKETIERCYNWASGYGYFLSRKAMGEVAQAFPKTFAEDVFVGQVLGPLNATGEIFSKHLVKTVAIYHNENGNSSSAVYDPNGDWMNYTYNRYKDKI
jgi:Galactosyltransferase